MDLRSQRGKEMYRDEYTLPRTNNSVEGWHCGFQSSVQCSHPTLWKLLDQPIRENELHRLTVVQLLAGQTHKPKRRVYRISNERITTSSLTTTIVHLLNF